MMSHKTTKLPIMQAGLAITLLLSLLGAVNGLETPLPMMRFFNSGSWPYAQRTWIALEECKADYETVTVDLQNKSEEFLELYKKANPIPDARAKVPLLQVDDDTFLCESMVVTEYIAEVYSSPLIPVSSKDRARMRLFVELCGSTFSYFPLLRAKQGEDFDAALQRWV